MRKVWIILLALFVALMLSGCENTVDKYPCAKYMPSNYRYNRRARTISLDVNSVLIDNHLYDIAEKEAGFDIILHFTKED